jgi:hypothetical protein
VHNARPEFIFSQENYPMKVRITVIALFLLLGFSGQILAQDPAATVHTGCATEIETYCSQVTEGEGRLLACFYAHEDKLSGACQFALYDASAQLEHAVSALNYVAGQCEDDIEKLCASVQAGEGRLLECLGGQKEAVSAECSRAIGDVFE